MSLAVLLKNRGAEGRSFLSGLILVPLGLLRAVKNGLQTTIELLTSTPNEAAAALLVPALDSPHLAVQEGALQAILKRRSPTGKREVLRRLDRFGDRWRSVLGEYRGRMTAALRDALLGSDPQMSANACQAILWFGEYDLMPALINAAEDSASPNAGRAAATLLELSEQLYQELAAPRDYRNRRDPQLVRQHVIQSLEHSLRRYSQHKRSEIVEAVLLLMNRENATLKKILQHPHDTAYMPVLEILKRSARPGVLRLLLSYLDDPQAPTAALTILAHRTDPKFLKHLTRKVGQEPSAAAAHNLKRIDHIAWLRSDLELLDALDDQGQHAAVQIAMASGMKRLEVFDLLAYLLRAGKAGGRRAAAAALADYHGADANALALDALEDPDPRVQAQILSQLRQRGIPGALPRLIEMVDSPHEVVRAAVRGSLTELSFERYLNTFEMLNDEVRRSTGVLVKKIDPQTVPQLEREMSQLSRTRRLRAIEICEAIGAVEALETQLVGLLSADDHMIRAAAARVLSQCNSAAVGEALSIALQDRSVVVQEVAQESLRQIARRNGWAARDGRL